MTTISDLPRAIVEEILSRVPLKSLSAVRSTCKTWNDLSKNMVLGQKAAGARNNEHLEFLVVDYSVCSLRFDLRRIFNGNYDSANQSMKEISIPNHQVKISQVIQCDGLLLCVLKDNPMELLVWNPYLGQSRLIQMRKSKSAWYALGYDTNRNHKILRVFDKSCDDYKGFEVYDFSSDLWRVYDVNPDSDLPQHHVGVSLKGNTYFIGLEKVNKLACFDFTTERFLRRLPLPYTDDFLLPTLCCVRDEKLAVLYCLLDKLEIWTTTKIELNVVSWSTFLRLSMSKIFGFAHDFLTYVHVDSFFLDEEEEFAVLIDRHVEYRPFQIACIIGKDGYFRNLKIIRPGLNRWGSDRLLCSSYVPSLVQVQINQQG